MDINTTFIALYILSHVTSIFQANSTTQQKYNPLNKYALNRIMIRTSLKFQPLY